MRKPTKRLFALLLAAVMVVGLLPVSALAARVAEDVTAEVPMGEEVVSASLAERPAVSSDADVPAQLAAADSLTISGYTRVTSLPEGGLDDGYYLFVVLYNGKYYMIYPGATGGGANVTNSARLEVDANGAATGYKVGAGTSYDSATVSTDFSAADNLVTLRGDSIDRGALYSATAVGQGGTTYYLCKKDTSGGGGAIYQTNCESAFTIHSGDSAGYFNLRHQVSTGSYLIFYAPNMNFNQDSSIGNNGGSFMLFKSNTKEPPLPTPQLQALIDQVNALTQADYTPKTWATLQTVLAAANSVLDSTDRQTLQDAIDALAAAKNALQARPTVPTPPAATLTYPAATATTFEDGVYVILNQAGSSRNLMLYNGTSKTDQWPTTPSNGQITPNKPNGNDDLVLWKITKVTDANTPADAYAVTIQGILNNKYLTSGAPTGSTQRALGDSAETFYITNTSGNEYQIKNSAGKYLAFLNDNHWDMSSTAATVRLYKQTSNIQTAEELRPAGGVTQNQPFPAEGLAGGDFFRIPSIVTVKGNANASLNGTLVAATDIRWKSHLDSSNIDTAVSWSSDNGATWHYSFPNFFGDTGLTVTANKSALFIDPILTADNSGNLYLMVNAFPAGVSTHGSSYQRPEETTGFVEINGVPRMTVYTTPENSAQDDDNYSYYIGDFAPISGSTTKYATIWDAYDNSDSGFYTDDLFNLYKQTGATKVPANDIIYCKQMGEGNATTDVWVQQNLFYRNATLHVRNAQFLYMVKSTDGGRTWSTPTILNAQVRTGEHQFYGPGPGAGICLDDGTIIIPTYTLDEHSSFIYSNDGGESWNRGPTLGWESTENMIVQIDDNTIRQFYRNRNHNLYYADYTRSGGVWTPNAAVFTGQQKQGNNQISALRYTGQIDGKDIIFVSTASNTADSAGGYARKGGKVIAFSLNEDNTMTYLATYRINQPTDWYGYSSLTQLTNGNLGILYESSQTDGNDSNNPGYCGLTYISISPYAILLPGLVERAKGLKEADYTPETWSGLATPLATAKAVQAGTSDTTVEDAYTALNNALKALTKVPVTISGTVTANSAPVPGAVVTLEDNNYAPVGLTATTDENGQFTFDNNNDADVTLSTATSYKLKVQVPGYDYQVTTVNAAAFDPSAVSDNSITLTARPAATYTNDFETEDISMLQGATGDAATATLTVVDHNGSKAVKISGLTGWNTPMHILDKNAHKLRNGVVAMDITPLTNNSSRFGFGLRADGAGQRVWVGHFEGSSTDWNFQSYDGGYGSIGSSGPILMTQNATRHVEVEMDGTTLKLWVDGVHVGTQTNLNIRNVSGYIGISSTRSSAQFIIDNIYVRRTDPKSAVTLTATNGTLTAKVIADDEESPLPSDALVYEEDTVVITGTPTDATTHVLDAVTVTKTGDASTTVPVTKNDDGSYQFTMPAYAVTVTGKFLPKVTGVTITGTAKQGKELTANVEPSGAEGKVTYQWQHKDTSGWVNCTDANSTAKTKTLTETDYNKQVRVIVTGNGADYASTVSVTSDPTAVIGPADVETSGVTIRREYITMWKNLGTDPATGDDTVEGHTTTVTATVDPGNATNKTIAWTSDNESIATVVVSESDNTQATITAMGNGTANIKAEVTSANGTKVSDTVAITVKTGIASITLTKGSDTLTSDSVLTIYANAGDPNKSVTVNAAVNDGADATALVWSCGHDGEDHIFQLGGADDAGAANGGSVVITAYDSHTLVGEETVTVSAPTGTGNTATAATFKVRVVHKLDDIAHSVSVAGYTGAPKVGDKLSANHSNLTPGFQLDRLAYQWICTKGSTETTVGNDATYTLKAADVGGTIKVKFTATPGDGFYYEGSLTSDATAAVEKKDGPAAPTLTATHIDSTHTTGTITITSDVAGAKFEYRKSTETGWTSWTSVDRNTIEDLVEATYQVRIKENTETGTAAGAIASIAIEDDQSQYYDVEVQADADQGTTTAAFRVKEGETAILTVKPNPGYTIQSVTAGGETLEGTTGEDGATEYTVANVGAKVTFVVTYVKKTVKITHSLSNLTCSLPENADHVVDYGEVHTITLTPDEGYDLPESIKVTYTDNTEAPTDRCTYTISDGKIIINFPQGVQRDITITATAPAKTYTASFDPSTGGDLTRAFTSATPIAYNSTLTATLTPASGYSAPAKASVEVTVGGTATTTFDYAVDETTGVATITVAKVKGHVVIKANSAVKNTTDITAASISGTLTEGNTLSITGVIPTGATYSVKWQRADAADGEYADVTNTGTYTLQSGDVGKYFKAVVSGTEDYSGSVTTAPVGPVVAKVVAATGVTIAAPEGSDNTVTMGSTLQLTASILPEDTTETAVKWSVTTGSDVASVSADGVVTPIKAGTATIQAQVIKATDAEGSASGVSDTIVITVITIPVASVSLNGTAQVGEELTATVSPAGATVSYTWEKVNANTGVVVATLASTSSTYTLVEADATYKIKVTATGSGNYGGSVSATTGDAVVGEDEVVPTYAITVAGGIANGAVTADKTEASSGQKINLTVTPAAGYELAALTVTAEDGTAVTVTDNAFFTMPGKAVTVTATFTKIVVTGVTLPATGSVKVGSATQLTATFAPAGATGTLEWSSSDPKVATVDANGKVTGVAEGTATITVTVEGTAFTADCVVTVTKKTTSSSSSSSAPATEVRPDGTKVTTETKPDGTKVQTVEEPDGTKSVTETKPDGSKTATVAQPDGTTSETVVTPEGDTTITVTDPDGEELVKTEIPATIPEPETKFVDIDHISWAVDAINNVAALNLVNGVGGGKYNPTASMTRGQIATVLHRLSNGKTDYKVAFKDVENDKYYAEGVAWAAKANVVKGVSQDRFAPDQIITREQMATMLCRYAKLIGMNTTAKAESLNAFVDGGKTGSWAVDSVAWCVENGILKGKSANNLDPNADVTRAEVAVMLDRFIALIQK